MDGFYFDFINNDLKKFPLLSKNTGSKTSRCIGSDQSENDFYFFRMTSCPVFADS